MKLIKKFTLGHQTIGHQTIGRVFSIDSSCQRCLTVYVVIVIKQCFNSTQDVFNGETVNSRSNLSKNLC